MEGKLDGRLRLLGWLGSVLFHLFLILLAARFLLQPPRLTVTAGATSTEIELSAVSPEPEPVIPPAPPVPALSPPVIPPVSIPPPPRMASPEAFSIPVTPGIFPKLSSSLPAARSSPAKALVRPSPSHKATAARPSNASKGVIEAQPDDLHNEPPIYPDESRMAHEEGVVILRVKVTATGEAASVDIEQSSGYFRLDQAARQAVKHWRFHPETVAGVPVPSEAHVPVRFKLE